MIKKIINLEDKLRKIERQRDDIGKDKEMIVNCQDDRGFSLSSIVIDSQDAKRILQFMYDYYTAEKERTMKEIEWLK